MPCMGCQFHNLYSICSGGSDDGSRVIQIQAAPATGGNPVGGTCTVAANFWRSLIQESSDNLTNWLVEDIP